MEPPNYEESSRAKTCKKSIVGTDPCTEEHVAEAWGEQVGERCWRDGQELSRQLTKENFDFKYDTRPFRNYK